MRNNRNRVGFSLVELLVVLGIIVTIIGLLLPAVSKARRAGKMAYCLSNLHNYAVAESNFAAQNGGGLAVTLIDLMPGGGNYFQQLTTCPAVSDYVNLPENGQGNYFYGFNSWVVSASAVAGGLKVSSITDSAEVALIADTLTVDQNGINLTSQPGLQDPFDKTSNLTLSQPSFHGRHGGSGSVLWIDGHASIEYATAVPTTLKTVPDIGGNPTQSPAVFNTYHLGYLVRSPADLSSMAAEYYFVAPKALLAQNKMAPLVIRSPYGNTANPVGW